MSHRIGDFRHEYFITSMVAKNVEFLDIIYVYLISGRVGLSF